MTDIVAKLATSTEQLTQPGMPFEIEERDIGGVSYRLYKQAPATAKELLDAGRSHGDRTFLVFEGEEWSFDDFYRQVDAIGHQLVNRYGVAKGQRIAIAMRNYPEWMAAYVAIVSLGAIVVPLNSWGQKQELEYGLRDSGAGIVFCDEQRYAHIADDLATMDVRAVVARAGAELQFGANAESYEAFIADGLGQALPAFDCDPEDPVMIMYTSGTTGNPKGALSCHRNLVQAIINFEFHAMSSAMANPETIEKMFASGFEPASLLAVPLFHVSGCYAMFLLSLRGGRKIVMMYKWDAGRALQMIEEHRITTLSAVPSMVIDVLEHPNFDKTDTSSLIALGAGGAACPPKFTKLVYEKVVSPYPGSGYGMTETNAACSSCTGEAFRYKPNRAGTVSPIVDVITTDEDGNELPRGETGEIWVKSPAVIREYWNKPEANASTFRDGWLATGDIGYVDGENFLFLVDRAKDMVIRGGENIYPVEIEACIHDHPAVHEVTAFGVPHDTLGEELAVAITTKPGQTLSADDIRSFVRERLAGFKVPSHVWLCEQPLPRNATGKILKKQVREQYLQQA